MTKGSARFRLKAPILSKIVVIGLYIFAAASQLVLRPRFLLPAYQE